jgi:NADH-quinone oxidoreductase subunit E
MEFKFTPENLERINKEIQKYPAKKPAVMATIYIAQVQNGYISNEVIKEVANILEMTTEEVLGVVTFYTMFHQ